VLFLIYWCVEKPLGRRMIMFVMLTGWLNSLLKEIFRQPRPFHFLCGIFWVTNWGTW